MLYTRRQALYTTSTVHFNVVRPVTVYVCSEGCNCVVCMFSHNKTMGNQNSELDPAVHLNREPWPAETVEWGVYSQH